MRFYNADHYIIDWLIATEMPEFPAFAILEFYVQSRAQHNPELYIYGLETYFKMSVKTPAISSAHFFNFAKQFNTFEFGCLSSNEIKDLIEHDNFESLVILLLDPLDQEAFSPKLNEFQLSMIFELASEASYVVQKTIFSKKFQPCKNPIIF